MPIYRFQLKSPLPIEAVTRRIQRVVREKPRFLQSIKESFGGRKISQPFIGVVTDDSFRIYRDISYRNSFLPQIKGALVTAPTGTDVSVTMSIHPLVALFMLFWLGGVGYGALAGFASQEARGALSLVPTGMFIFGIGLTAFGFYPEARKARRLLEEAIAATDSDQS
jgi:hypothetical protein